MFRNRRKREAQPRVFSAVLRIHQLDSIPSTSTLLYVHWALPRVVSSDQQTGRTKSKPVEAGNVVQWHEDFATNVSIPSEPTDSSVLQPCVLRLSIRSERRRKAGFDQQGVVDIDLTDVADTGRISRSFLVHESLLNCTLKVSVRLHLKSGEAMFRPRATGTAGKAPLPLSTPSRGLEPGTTYSGGTAVQEGTDLPPATAADTDLPSGVPRNASALGAVAGANNGDAAPQYTLDDLEAVMAGKGRDRAFPSDVPVAGTKPVLQRAGNGMATGNHLAMPAFPADHSAFPRTMMANGVRDEIGAVLTKGDGDELLSLQRDVSNRDASLAPFPGYDPALRSRVLTSQPVSPPQALLRPGAVPPLSPRSPSGSVASKVLDYLAPEAVQSSVYEEMRLQRIRKQVSQEIVDTREPIANTIGRILEVRDAGSSEGHSIPPVVHRTLANLFA